MTMLTAELRSCLSRADKLNLPMVGIYIEQACTWLVAHGQDETAVSGDRIESHAAPIA